MKAFQKLHFTTNYGKILTVVLATLLVGCTSVHVSPVSQSEKINHVVIRKNSKVAVDDFLEVLVEGFQQHGITTQVDSSDSEWRDFYVVNYVAYRNWDMAPYLCDATITIDWNGRRVAEASYHLMLKGGLSLMKWEGTKAKMNPVIDELLENVKPKL
jgi:hypothetical protein